MMSPVSLGSSTRPTSPPAVGQPQPVQPAQPALRARTPGWRDPRLWTGIVIVAASVVLGARLLAAADDTVAVWATVADAGAGDRLTAEDLEVQQVRFADDAALAGYFTADQAPPDELLLIRPVGAGELLPRAAVGAAEGTGLLHVPVAVDPELVPPSVDAGAVVDVHLVPSAGAVEEREATGPALSSVTVLEAPELATSFGTTGRRQLVLAVPEEDAQRYFQLLATYDAPVVTVVRRG